jgi:hypothetical protein
MLAHPTIIRDYMGARLVDGLRRAEAVAVVREPRTDPRPWSHGRLPAA